MNSLWTCITILLSFIALAGCAQSTAAPPFLPAGLHPLTASVTIGSQPIEGARQVETKQITFGDPDDQSWMVVTSQSIINAVQTDRYLEMRTEVLSTKIETHNVRGLDLRPLVRRLRMLEGTVIQLRIGDRRSETEIRVTKNGGTSILAGEVGARIAGLINQFHLGGQTVRQGQKVIEFSLSEVAPGANAAGAAGVFAGHVLGQALHYGRTVIVVGVAGRVEADGATIQSSGTYLVDILTGMPLYGQMALSGIEMNETDMAVLTSKRVTL